MRTLSLALALAVATLGCSTKSTPVKIPQGAMLEVYMIATAQSADTIPATDPVSGGPLFLQTPPIITTTDVATVARSETEIESEDGTPSDRTQPTLDVELTPAGSAKMAAATAAPSGERIAVVINGKVVSTPTLHAPIQKHFQITGDSKDAGFISAVRTITTP